MELDSQRGKTHLQPYNRDRTGAGTAENVYERFHRRVSFQENFESIGRVSRASLVDGKLLSFFPREIRIDFPH